MPKRSAWTDDQLRIAVAQSTSWRAVARTLGLASGSTHRVGRRAEELGLATAHMTGNRRWDRAKLRETVRSSRSWEDVAATLGAHGSDIGRIRGAAKRLQIDASHLDEDRHAAERLPESAPCLSRLSQAAEFLASGWLVMSGRQVLIPTVACPFDLLVSDGDKYCRVQVKTTTHRDREGRWIVVVARRPYRREASGGRESYDHDEVDAFFIINAVGECFLIPIAQIAGRISIVLDHYRRYYVGCIDDLFHAGRTVTRSPGPADQGSAVVACQRVRCQEGRAPAE